jgi:hypothetical protein
MTRSFPETVALTLCPAYVEGTVEKTTISGLWDVVEFKPTGPFAYIESSGTLVPASCWILTPHTTGDYPRQATVDHWDFISQVDPDVYAASLQIKRNMGFVGPGR